MRVASRLVQRVNLCAYAYVLAYARVCVNRDIPGGGFDAECDRDMFYRDKPGGGSQKHPCHA